MRIVIDISEEDLNIIEADEDFPSTNEETLWRLIDAVLSGKRISETDENGKRGSMTSKEALEILKKYKEESEEDYYVNRARALDMAIKALEQKDWKFYYDHGYAQAKRDLQEPKTGHWIDMGYTFPSVQSNREWRCDNCHHQYRWFEPTPKYCPNCGAKMESEVE